MNARAAKRELIPLRSYQRGVNGASFFFAISQEGYYMSASCISPRGLESIVPVNLSVSNLGKCPEGGRVH